MLFIVVWIRQLAARGIASSAFSRKCSRSGSTNNSPFANYVDQCFFVSLLQTYRLHFGYLNNFQNIGIFYFFFKYVNTHYSSYGEGLIEVQPPSTTRLWPVICLAPSETMNKTAWAISLTWASLPIGVSFSHVSV